jgi:hypothetical protein
MKRIFSIVLALIVTSCSINQPVPIPTASATIIPPTETAAPPFDSPTPTVVVTETVTVTPTPENRNAIDLNKLNYSSASYAEYVANLDKHQEAPNPLVDSVGFQKWWADLKTTLGGDGAKMPVNCKFAGNEINGVKFGILNTPDTRQPLQGNLPSFYFIDNGQLFITLLFTCQDTNTATFTYAVVTASGGGEFGTDGEALLANLSAGNKIHKIVGIMVSDPGYPVPESWSRLVNAGLNWYGAVANDPVNKDNFFIGPGAVTTTDD